MQVNARQERGLLEMEKEQKDFPKLLKNLHDENRILKMEKQKAAEKVAKLERLALLNSEEHHRLLQKIKDLQAKAKEWQATDYGKLQKLNDELKAENEDLKEQIGVI
jgi:ABC-type transporter Mla subunit MlaD